MTGRKATVCGIRMQTICSVDVALATHIEKDFRDLTDLGPNGLSNGCREFGGMCSQCIPIWQ